MRDAEFRAMLQASRERNKHNSYAYTDTPTSYELPKFTKKERKGIDEVIRAITPRERYMPTRKTTKNSIKNYLANFDSHELPTDAYCALLAVMCAKLIGIVEHHIAVGNIEPMENEQPDFEFDPYILEEF
ncbi:TPA: hypothetical protein ACP2EC_001697 [Escherichia coli]